MKNRLTSTIAAGVSLAMLVTALWAWGDAARLSDGATRPEVQSWAVRCGAVAVAAAAQALLLSVVLRRRRREDPDDLSLFVPVERGEPVARFLSWSAGLVSAVALVSAIALALAGR